MRRSKLGFVVSLTILSAACSGQVSSPLSPSALAPAATPAATGATVLGDVRLAATAPAIGSASDPLKVQVVGTGLVAVVSPTGQFSLSDVPPGDVQLHFTGAGVDARVTISQVGAGETVTITVTVLGTDAVVESQVRQGSGAAHEEQIEGRIEALPPAVAPGTLQVAGRTVTTDASTLIRQGDTVKSFADLAVGQRVHVKGQTAGTVWLARLIEIQNTQTDLPVQVNGVVQNLSGSELAFQFTVDGRLVTGDARTEFAGDGGRAGGFTDLKNGVRVEVKGVLQQTTSGASVYAVRIKVNTSNDDRNPPPGTTVELDGTVGALAGACPALTFRVSGTPVTTTSATEFAGGGCAAVRNGSKVSVKGTRQGDGSVLAAKVEVKDKKSSTDQP
jgi:hypothetical protein